MFDNFEIFIQNWDLKILNHLSWVTLTVILHNYIFVYVIGMGIGRCISWDWVGLWENIIFLLSFLPAVVCMYFRKTPLVSSVFVFLI